MNLLTTIIIIGVALLIGRLLEKLPGEGQGISFLYNIILIIAFLIATIYGLYEWIKPLLH